MAFKVLSGYPPADTETNQNNQGSRYETELHFARLNRTRRISSCSLMRTNL